MTRNLPLHGLLLLLMREADVLNLSLQLHHSAVSRLLLLGVRLVAVLCLVAASTLIGVGGHNPASHHEAGRCLHHHDHWTWHLHVVGHSAHVIGVGHELLSSPGMGGGKDFQHGRSTRSRDGSHFRLRLLQKPNGRSPKVLKAIVNKSYAITVRLCVCTYLAL